MNKNDISKKHKAEDENDVKHSAVKVLCCNDEECCDDSMLDMDSMSDVMISMVDAAGHQMTLTNELTKIVVEKSTKEMSAEEIFVIFKQAAAVIAEASPLKELMQNLPTK